MEPVRFLRHRAGLTQTELARRAGTSQPTLAAYEAGRKSPNLRTLERLAAAVGFDVAVRFVPPMTREDRRSLFLHAAIARRLASTPDQVLRHARQNVRRMRERDRAASNLLIEWRRVLARPLGEIIDVMTDPGPHARDLRQVTPFAGALSTKERTAVYRAFRDSEKPAV